MDSRTSAAGNDLAPPAQPRLFRRDPFDKVVGDLLGDRPNIVVCAPTAAEFAVVRRTLRRESRLARAYRDPFGIKKFGMFAVFGRKNFWAFQTGLGERTTECVRTLSAAFDFESVCLLGYAGGLDPALRLGCTIEPNGVYREARGEAVAPLPLEVGERSATLLTVATPALTADRKAALYEQTGCAAVDMEAFPLGDYCREIGKPFHVVRVISDDASEELPHEIVACVRPDGDLSGASLAGTLAVRPRLWPKVVALWRRNRVAVRKLADATAAVMRRLA